MFYLIGSECSFSNFSCYFMVLQPFGDEGSNIMYSLSKKVSSM